MCFMCHFIENLIFGPFICLRIHFDLCDLFHCFFVCHISSTSPWLTIAVGPSTFKSVGNVVVITYSLHSAGAVSHSCDVLSGLYFLYRSTTTINVRLIPRIKVSNN
jgi:hypothetical protein